MTVATDVYSLGVLLYRLLTGRSPYRGDMTQQAGIVQAVCVEEPLRPSDLLQKDAGASADDTAHPIERREVRGDLDAITLKALQKEPARRYGSVEQFAEDIHRHLEYRPILAAPDSWAYRAGKFLARHRLGAAAAAIVLVATLTATLISVRQAQVAQRQRAAAQQRFEMVRKLARAVVFDLNDALENVPGATSGRKLIIGTAIEYLNALSADELADAGLMREVAAAYLKIGDIQGNPFVPNLNDPEGSRASYEHALQVYRRLAAREPSIETDTGMAQAHSALGVAYWAKGDSATSLAHYREMRRLNEALAKSAPATTGYRLEIAQADYQIGQVYLMLGDAASSRENYQRSLEVAEAVAAADPADAVARRRVGVGYLKLGDVAMLEQDHGQALIWFRRSAEAFGELKRQPSPLSGAARLAAFAQLRIGEAMRYSDRRSAEAVISTVLPALEATGAADEANAQALFDLGYANSLLGAAIVGQRRPVEAVRVLQAAVADLRRGLADNPQFTDVRRDLGLALFWLGSAHLEGAQFTAAIAAYQDALRLLEAPDLIPRAKSEVAEIYQLLGDAQFGVVRMSRDDAIRAAAREAGHDSYGKSVNAWAVVTATRALSSRELASLQKAMNGGTAK